MHCIPERVRMTPQDIVLWGVIEKCTFDTCKRKYLLLRYALKKKRYHLGIFPNMGGGGSWLSLILESSGGHDVCELCLITNFAQSSAQNIVFKARHWRQPCRLSAWQTRLGRRSLQGLIMYPLVERFGQVEVEEDKEVALWANWSQSGRL